MKTIVIASGGFDPIHVGHIEYLEKARELGDELIVIVNNDESLAKKKGKTFMKERERQRIVQSLRCVDNTFIQVSENAHVNEELRFLREINMNHRLIFAKGGDRFIWEIPEREICEELGIELVDGLGEKIQSSSWLIEGAKE